MWKLWKYATFTYAEKSAAAVAALVASLFKVAPQTAPLWPKNVPIQSPVSPWRNIGLPSAKIKKVISTDQLWLPLCMWLLHRTNNKFSYCLENMIHLYKHWWENSHKGLFHWRLDPQQAWCGRSMWEESVASPFLQSEGSVILEMTQTLKVKINKQEE